jgi:two-component system, chemotaxis family, sensor kinase Cph1
MEHAAGEPIFTIQPHGVLLVVSKSAGKILQISQNSLDLLGIAAPELIGQTWQEFAGGALPLAAEMFQTLNLKTPLGQRNWDLLCHGLPEGWIVELEPHQPAPAANLLHQVGQSIERLRRILRLEEFLQQAVQEVQQLLGYDRVHIFRFDQQGAGEVVAATAVGELPSYLGLHFPATDIPAPVQAMYRQGMQRYVPNVAAAGVKLWPALSPLTGQPLGLSPALLRATDTCCDTYHQNMGVAAFWALPLLVDDQLWGLLSCHHRQPHYPAAASRTASAVLRQFIAAELANKLHQQELADREQLRSLHADLIASIAQAEDFRTALVSPQPRLLNLVNAQGAAVCLGGEITLVGQTPETPQVLALLDWVAPQVQASPDNLFATEVLPQLYPEALEFRQVGCGLLVLCISSVRQYYLLWFRPEVTQTIDWGGNPADSFQTDANGQVTLCPRASFALWQETVALTALPWQAAERQSALDLRTAIVGIVLTKADDLARINLELQQKNNELEAFAFAASHDLQEPLRGIYNFANLLLKHNLQDLDPTGQSRLQTIMRLARRMETLVEALLRFSRLGQKQLQLQPVNLNPLVAKVLEVIQASRPEQPPEIHIPHPLPTLVCDPVLISEVFTNLLSNACKYTDQPQAKIEIGYLATAHPPTLYVKDNGIGIRPRHLDTVFRLFKRLHEQALYGGGTGVGLTISRKIIERHGGKIWVESTYGAGATFYFTLGSD